MKMWLLLGSTVDDCDPCARTKHRQVNVTTIELWSPDEIEALKPDDVVDSDFEEIPSGSE